MVDTTHDPFLRVPDVLRDTGLSKSVFYELRKSADKGAPEPEGFPPPDAFLNGGNTPVWYQSTSNRWKRALVEASRALPKVARAKALHTRRKSTTAGDLLTA